jgi:hypothetical protein
MLQKVRMAVKNLSVIIGTEGCQRNRQAPVRHLRLRGYAAMEFAPILGTLVVLTDSVSQRE